MRGHFRLHTSLLDFTWPARLGIGLLLLVLVTATRVPLAPKYLYYFDHVNFALALEEFNPALHQPQPPGYPLFVLFARLMYLLAPRPEWVFLAAGILTATLAVIALWFLGEAMFSSRAGLAAAALLLFNPVFWMSGLSNQVRLWLAAGAAIVALACWRALEQPWSPRTFAWACAALGLLSGFRPAMLLFLLPLLLFSGLAGRRPRRQWLLGLGVLGVSAAAWLSFTLWAAGGLPSYLRLLRDYAGAEFSPSSLLLGSSLASAGSMAMAALVWNGLGIPSWIWAAPLAGAAVWSQCRRRQLAFLAAWFVPAFLFHSIVHVEDPDQVLVTVPVLCLAGGVVLAALSRRLTREGWFIAVSLAVVINVLLFFFPFHGLAGASDYRAVEYVDTTTRSTFDAIRRLQASGPVMLVSYNSFITWRNLSYYFPDLPVLVLSQDHRGPVDPSAAWVIQKGRTSSPALDGAYVRLPAGTKVVFLLPPDPAIHQELAGNEVFRHQDPLLYVEAQPGQTLNLGAYQFKFEKKGPR